MMVCDGEPPRDDLRGSSIMGWILVAKVGEVSPGKGTVVIAEGRELALFLVEGKYYCLNNTCPHMEGPLGEGEIEGATVYCPWHWWPFDIRTGAMTYDPDVCAAAYPCM